MTRQNDILVRYDRNPLRGLSKNGFIQEIRSLLRGRVESAWIFGSLAAGDFSRTSDIDLILVTETEVPFVLRPSLFEDLIDRFPALDLLVYTPQEFTRLISDPSPGFWRSVTGTMERIL
ncbi:MAG: nucleotidyltransferase domain-containing protein [Spirochaetales bacterium]|nr:nucleotidyltransferase domain-containing protein [Spirochaetales bacterium]MCF7939480.1 nucleotidyltransferase domain-containing protein [Spirochaetales bacterium]